MKSNVVPRAILRRKIKHNKKGTLTAIWAEEVCGNCPIFSSCAAEKGKNGYRLRYNHKEVEASFRRRYEQSEDFKEKYRYRAGIEATNSRFIHMTGARRMRYRGLKRIDYAARLKALGIIYVQSSQIHAHAGGKPVLCVKMPHGFLYNVSKND